MKHYCERKIPVEKLINFIKYYTEGRSIPVKYCQAQDHTYRSFSAPA